jgi:hypothetical protein
MTRNQWLWMQASVAVIASAAAAIRREARGIAAGELPSAPPPPATQQ